VYSDDDIRKLMEAALQLHSRRGLQATTFATLFGLLAVTGLRIGECLALDHQDVDLVDGILHVRQAKFGKSRLVPLHPSACNALNRYATLRRRIFPQPKDNRFFVSERGTGLTLAHFRRTFWRLARRIGLRGPVGQRGPRIHDFRHGFGIRTVKHLYRGSHRGFQLWRSDFRRRLAIRRIIAGCHGHDDIFPLFAVGFRYAED
jgi:integrase/recombinase XerD